MPDETAAPGTGTSGSQEGAPASSGQGFDFERGYQELRPAYTQATQRLSEYEDLFAALHDSDPAVQAEAAELLGLELAAETGALQTQESGSDEEFVDPLEKEVKELSGLVAELREQSELEASAKQEAKTIDLRDEYIGEAIGLIEGELSQQAGASFKFSEQEEEVLGNLAIAMADEDSVPDVQQAYQRLYGDDGIIESRFQQRIDTKLGAAPAPSGTTIPADKKPKNAEERIAYMDRRWRDLADQQ